MSAAGPLPWNAHPCPCGCPQVIRTVEDLQTIRAAHPEEFEDPSEGPAPHPDDEIERLIEEGRRIPTVERLNGLFEESWAEITPG